MSVTREQSLSALEKANQVRLARASALRAISTGTISFADALALDVLQEVRVERLLRAQRQWGAGRAERALDEAAVRPTAIVATLQEHERATLIALVSPKPVNRRVLCDSCDRWLLPCSREKGFTRCYVCRSGGTRKAAKPQQRRVVDVSRSRKCVQCGDRLRNAVPSGLCGFCQAEQQVAA